MYCLCNNYYSPDDHIYDFCVIRSVALVTTLDWIIMFKEKSERI